MKAVLLLAFLFVGCANAQRKSNLINAGDSKETVISVMGQPENRQFKESLEAWQYCDTLFGKFNFSVVWFQKGVVTGVNTKSVGAAHGLCDGEFPTVKWEDAPNSTIEIRNR